MRSLGTAIFVFVLFEARDENREPHFFVFLLVFARFFVPLASPKVLSLGKTQINLVFRSLIRTFAADFEIKHIG